MTTQKMALFEFPAQALQFILASTGRRKTIINCPASWPTPVIRPPEISHLKFHYQSAELSQAAELFAVCQPVPTKLLQHNAAF
jgi:hypothetical protein